MSKKTRYFKLDQGGILKLEDDTFMYYLSKDGEWIHEQYFITILVDANVSYSEISEDEVSQIIQSYKESKGRLK